MPEPVSLPVEGYAGTTISSMSPGTGRFARDRFLHPEAGFPQVVPVGEPLQDQSVALHDWQIDPFGPAPALDQIVRENLARQRPVQRDARGPLECVEPFESPKDRLGRLPSPSFVP